jgi:hypothetical protein
MKNSAELNNYYDLINKYVDDYLMRWNENIGRIGRVNKVRPSELKTYLSKPRLERFLARHGLKDVTLIDRVVNDVIEDRVAMEKDGVMTFESYNMEMMNVEEQDLMTGLDGAGLEHEKLIADFFDVSLSSVNVISPVRHHFKVSAPGIENECIIITKDEIVPVKENLLKLILDKLSSQKVELDFSGTGIEIPLKGLISEEKLKEKIEMINDTNLDNWLGMIMGGKTERDDEHRVIILKKGATS